MKRVLLILAVLAIAIAYNYTMPSNEDAVKRYMAHRAVFDEAVIYGITTNEQGHVLVDYQVPGEPRRVDRYTVRKGEVVDCTQEHELGRLSYQ